MAVIGQYGAYDGISVDSDADGYAEFSERRGVRVDWTAIIAAGYILRWRHWGKVGPGAAAGYTPQLIDESDDSEVATGAAVTLANYPADGSEDVIVVTPGSGVKNLRPRLKSVTGSSFPNNGLYGYGFFEVVPTGAP